MNFPEPDDVRPQPGDPACEGLAAKSPEGRAAPDVLGDYDQFPWHSSIVGIPTTSRDGSTMTIT